MPFDIVNWMSSVKDSRKLSELTIPGTHDSAARAQPGVGGRFVTQALGLQAQLNAGVRFFDIRARYINNRFQLYHEDTDLKLGFDAARDILMTFLAEHPRETIIMSLKEESDATGNDPGVTFEDRFDRYVDENRALWYLRNEIPTLGQVRGKIVLFRRFPAERTPKGINAHPFENDKTFTIEGPPKLRIQDWYHVLATNLSKSRKWGTVEALLKEASEADPINEVLYVNFTSGAGLLPRNTPKAVADYINPKLRMFFRKTLGRGPTRFGIVVMDFADADIVALIVRASAPDNVVPDYRGYWIVDERASVAALRSAVAYPASGGAAAVAVAIAATPTGSGYWILAPDGKVYGYGRARNVGEGVPDGTKATSMAVHPAYDGFGRGGYWILADNGRVGAFGVQDYGGIEPTPNLRAVSIVATPDGGGYWILAFDGSVHVFGNATPHGDRSDAGQVAVAMAATRDGGGYWILSSNGAIHPFGNAVHYGQDERSGATARAMAVTQDGGGYWVLYSDGDVRNFGSAPELPPAGLGAPAAGIAVDNNYFFFRSKLNDFVVDVTGANPAAGTPLVAFPQKRRGAAGNLDNQLWMFVPPPPNSSGFDFIASKQTGLAIDIQGGDRAPKTPLVVDPRKTSEADVQLWSLSPSDSEPSLRYVFIRNRLTREVIDIENQSREPKAPLIAFPPNGHSGTDNQLWLVVRFF